MLPVGGFERIFGATLFFGTDTMSGQGKAGERTCFNFLQEAQIGMTAASIRVPYPTTLNQRPNPGQNEIRPD